MKNLIMSTILKQAKIVFMGTPDFGASVLNSLIKKSNVIAVVTQPDKKVGRDQILTASPIKKLALQQNIEVLQPERIKGNAEFVKRLKDLQADLIVVVAYGLILPKEVIELPKFGVVNVHASLLPKYRGASPIQAAILNGDKKTGVTIMLIDEQLDHGPILSQKDLKISKTETFETLHDKLAVLGANLLIKTLPDYLDGRVKSQEQDHSLATFCKRITKIEGKIDWSKSGQEIERMVRAFYPWPGAWTTWNNKNLKILAASADTFDRLSMTASAVGEVLEVKGGIAVACGKDALEILELQLEGKKPMVAKEFLNGYPEIVGSILK